jgi:hypothetical protein
VTDLKEKNNGKRLYIVKEYPGLIIPPPFVHNKKYLQKNFVNVAMHFFSNNRKDTMIENGINVRYRQDIKIVH